MGHTATLLADHTDRIVVGVLTELLLVRDVFYTLFEYNHALARLRIDLPKYFRLQSFDQVLS
jgi:hypothetical protein